MQGCEIEAAHPELVTASSPAASRRVCGRAVRTVVHRQRMYSLDNAMDLDELDEWMEPPPRPAEGASAFVLRAEDRRQLIAHLRDSVLVRAATQRRHHRGEDVTVNMRTVRDVPRLRDEARGAHRAGVQRRWKLRGKKVLPSEKELQGARRRRRGGGPRPFANPPQRRRWLAAPERMRRDEVRDLSFMCAISPTTRLGVEGQ